MYDAFLDQRLPILPERLHSSTFGVWGLNYCVRHGNRWDPSAIITGFSFLKILSHPQNFTEDHSTVFLRFFKSSLRPISIGPLHTSRYFHSRPIYLVIFKGSYQLSLEKLHLKAGFTLRCFQRLSFPDVATQLYAWRHNWYTIGPSTPVLSY